MNINWNKISAIGTLLGAIATFTASYVSLYIANKSTKKKILLKAYDAQCIVGGNDNNLYVSINITNVGVRQINIAGVGYKNRKKTGFAFMNPSYTSTGDITPFKQYLINPEENFFYMLDRAKLIEYIQSENVHSNDIKLFCRDSTGKVYYCKLPKSVSSELWPKHRK